MHCLRKQEMASRFIVDLHCELNRGSSGRKQELAKELQRNGVTFDIRKLNVGDFLWVAREKVTPVPGRSTMLYCNALQCFTEMLD